MLRERRQFLALSGGLLVRQWMGGAGVAAAHPDGTLEQLEIFPAGAEGYASYRIPGLVVTRRGTLLAYAEARRTGRGDWDAIDIVLRRSVDGGRSWSPQRVVARVPGARRNPVAARERPSDSPEDLTYNNPVAIADPQTGTVHLLFCLEYARCFAMRSEDDGQTFSAPRELTGAFEGFRREQDWKVIATGPGHGIRLRSGRLVVPVWLSPSTGKSAHHPSDNGVIFSDDGGETWQAGGLVGRTGEVVIDPSEAAVAELADGRLYFNSRSESKAHRRLVSESRDGGATWSTPRFDDALVEPICMASLVRVSAAPRRSRLLFANPANLDVDRGEAIPGRPRARRNLTIRLSYDEGRTWPVSRTLEAGTSGYSDLAAGPDGTIYCLYEAVLPGADLFRQTTLRLARFPLTWLTNGKDSWEPLPAGRRSSKSSKESR